MEKDIVEYLAKALVDKPDEVQVSMVEGEKSTIIELRVDPDDIGKVIGKGGRIAQAIRVLINASASGSKKRVVLEILD